jgi:hypothetical protein
LVAALIDYITYERALVSYFGSRRFAIFL